MPEFTNAFSGQKEDRMLTHDELVRAIRFMIAAEYEEMCIRDRRIAALYASCSGLTMRADVFLRRQLNR